MATKAAFSSLYGEGPEEQKLVDEIKGSYAKLREALDARERGPLFDPVLLAMAQGFLAPTKTGGFGESLANAAALVGPAQAEQEKRARENAMMRMELAQQQLGQMQQSRIDDLTRQALGVGQPAQQPSGAAVGAESGDVAQAPKNEYGLIPQQFIDAMRARGPQGRALAEEFDKANKARMERQKFLAGEIKTTEGGAYKIDPAGNVTYTPRPGAKGEEVFIPGEASYAMEPGDLIKLRAAREVLSQNPQDEAARKEYFRLIDKYRVPVTRPIVQPDIQVAPIAPQSQTTKTGPMTPGEEAARRKALEIEAEAVAKGRAANTVSVMNAAKASTALIPIYETMESTINKPGMDKVMGVFERPNLLAGLGALVEDAVRVGNFNIGLPAIRKVITNSFSANQINAEARKAGVTPQQLIDDLSFLGQSIAMTQFNQRQGLGSGTSVSNFEQIMVNAMGPTIQDTVGSFRKKLAFMKNKSQFEIELGRAMKESGMQYDDFESTPAFKKMFSEYQKKQTGVVYGERPPAPTGARTFRFLGKE